MVLNKFAFLTRQGLGKTLTHVPQTFVAGTQSSYASSSSPFAPLGNHGTGKFGKAGSAHLHTSFQGPPSPAVVYGKAASGSGNGEKSDSGLAAYYDAWQKQHQPGAEEKEWKQFQFTKRIGWKTPTAAVLAGRAKEREELGLRSEARLNHGSLNRAYSASAVDDIKKSDDAKAEVEALAKVDEAIAEEISQFTNPASTDNHVKTFLTSPESVLPSTPKVRSASPHSVQSRSTGELSTVSWLLSNETATTPDHSVDDAASFGEHIRKLSDAKRYAEIPPVFESMLTKGLRPTIQAYNGLLSAVVHLPIAKHQVVPKALDVYTDMLRRGVVPDTVFYTALIQLLSHHALDVADTKQEMEKRRMRFNGLAEKGRFLFESKETEYDMLLEDDSLANAVKIFESSLLKKQDRLYSSETYRLLVTACAQYGKVDEMIRVYSHMEVHKVVPIASMFPSMIEAFGISGDLASVVECYNEYKALAISDDNGKLVVLGRKDNEVYTAVIKAYASCDKLEAGKRFYDRILGSYDLAAAEKRGELLSATRDSVLVHAFVQQRVDSRDFVQALKIAEDQDLSSSARNKALATVTIAAADTITATATDSDTVDISTTAYRKMDPAYHAMKDVHLSMLAKYIRDQDVYNAKMTWFLLLQDPKLDETFIEYTALYSMFMLRMGEIAEGLIQAKEVFTRIRRSAGKHLRVLEAIDEAIERIAHSIYHFDRVQAMVGDPSTESSTSIYLRSTSTSAASARVAFIRAMKENRGLVSPAAEQTIAYLGAEEIARLSWQDLKFLLQIQAEILPRGHPAYSSFHPERFRSIVATMANSRTPVDQHTSDLVDYVIAQVGHHHPSIEAQWRDFQRSVHVLDPYAETTDFPGSTMIASELDDHRYGTAAALGQALSQLSNMRDTGRHPSYIVYSKIITAAAKEGREELVHQLLGFAEKDTPFLPYNQPVRDGWSFIYDAMVGACLTFGNRTLAGQYHEKLRSMGASPTANTYGLYITTMKGSTNDEASDALKIFKQAQNEGVEPTSFLYNALIGKLAKARRINDCLYHFSEMRSLGIRPTSVTYGTIVNALCRVSDWRQAEEFFEEMESMPNYKPKAAPYNCLMQFFLETKRDSQKVLAYYERMQSTNIQPTMHTYKLLIQTYATLEPINLSAAEGVLETIRASGQKPEANHYASLIKAKGCALHDMAGARRIFDDVLAKCEVRPEACLYQALFESMVANHNVSGTEPVLQGMASNRIPMTPYIANTLIRGWATQGDISKAHSIYDRVGREGREPTTYEAMTRAFLSAGLRSRAMDVFQEMMSKNYPPAVSAKSAELLGLK
ncbi:MAG: hypothetical protein Q9191_006203 [Dirinaria sp. TL-2023a]